MPEEVVYVLGTPGSNIVKIGRTTSLTKRVADIQRMSPVPLTVLWSHPGGHELETHLHRQFADLRSHGEWFAFTTADPVGRIREAVQSFTPPAATPGARTKPDGATLQQWCDDLDEATADHTQNRSALEEVIAGCRTAGLSLTLIADHSPFSREWVRRIADRVDRERVSSQP